jgi:hypothetical protein
LEWLMASKFSLSNFPSCFDEFGVSNSAVLFLQCCLQHN